MLTMENMFRLSTQLPAIEDACSDADVQCCVKNTKTLLLPMTHTHFRAPKLSMLHKFSKSARKFVHNSLKKIPKLLLLLLHCCIIVNFFIDYSLIDRFQIAFLKEERIYI